MKDKNIILIGGAPTVGKSTIGSLVAKHLNLPWISTDHIRNIMRITASRDIFPTLFNPEGMSGEQFLKKFSADEIVEIEFRQAEAVWIGVKDFILHDYTWTEGFVIEGVNLLPHLISRDLGTLPNVQSVFLVDEDPDRIRNVIFKRGLWDDADKYADNVKEKEVEWVKLFSHKLKLEADQYGYRSINVKKNEDDIVEVLKVLHV